ncbi:MAG: hypothetical protein ABJC13_03935 [Acidobacteriota bacterium]
MPHALSYLFRRAGGNVFLCASAKADQEIRYETACGHCGYPILADQSRCPRCRRELENCPCCNAIRHVRSPLHDPDPETEIKICTVCGVRRSPFGIRKHSELDDSFCTNIFGCPVGGLLLPTGEFALLPRGASRCPICEHATLKPLAVRSFLARLEKCLFCHACFSSESLKKQRVKDSIIPPELPAGFQSAPAEPCLLCGRRDHRVKDSDEIVVPQYDGASDEWLESDDYRVLVVVGHALIQEVLDQSSVEASIFRLASYNHELLSRVTGVLVGGTHDPVVRKILEGRTRHLIESFQRQHGPERQ